MTDRIIKSGIELYDPVCHGMSYPDSDGQEAHSMSDRIIKSGIERDRHYLDSSFQVTDRIWNELSRL